MMDENYEKAISDFQETIAKDKPNEKVYYQLGVSYLKTDQKDLADQSFGLALKSKPGYIPALTEQLKLKYKKDDFTSTLDLAGQLLEAEPINKKGLYYKAMSLMKTDSLDQAYAAFDAYLTVDGENKTVLKNRANISIKQKNYESAVKDYTALIAVDPDHMNYYNRALSYMRIEKWAESLADLDKVITMKPDYAEAFYNRSNVQLQLENNDAACSDMREAVKLGYDDAVQYVIGLCGN